MSSLGRSVVTVAALASLLTFASIAKAATEPHPDGDPRGIKNFLTEKTLTYPGAEGKENFIHFGRFGNFDWYFPCEIESGTWSLAEDQTLNLTYHNSDFTTRQYKLERQNDGVKLIESGSENITVATLLEGNQVPYF